MPPESQDLKVLFLPRWYPNANDWLDGNFIENHARAVGKRCNVAVLFAAPGNDLKKPYSVEIANEHGVRVFRVYYQKVNSNVSFFSNGLRLIRYLRAILSGYQKLLEDWGKPDLNHVHVLSRPGLLALWLKWTKGVRFVVTEHWSGYLPSRADYKGFLKKRLTELTIRNAELVTAVSQDLAKAMLNHGLKNEYIVVPNVVDETIFYPGKENHVGKKKILHVSNLDERAKNFQGILTMMAQLKKQRIDFEFHVYGDGPDKELQMATAEKMELQEPNIIFYGNRQPTEIAEAMRTSDFLLMFSNYENQPCVILEALCCGLPVLATSVGGIPEVMNSDMGEMIDPGDPSALLRLVNKYLDGELQFDREQISKTAAAKYSDETVGRQFLELYQKVLSIK